MIKQLLYIAHDHLNFDRGVLKTADPATQAIILVESQRMITGRDWHPERIYFLLASARQFAVEGEARGFTVRYIQAPTTIDGLTQARSEFGDVPILAAEPSSFKQLQNLKDFGVQFVENDFF